MPKANRGTREPVGPPSVRLLLSDADRRRIVAQLEALPAAVRGKNVGRLVDLVEAALMENTNQLWGKPPPDRGPEEALVGHIRGLLQSLTGMQPALAAMPPTPGHGYAYWSQPFARAVYEVFPSAKFAQHAAFMPALASLVALTSAMQPAVQAAAADAIPAGEHANKPRKRNPAAISNAIVPQTIEPVGRLVRAVCYYLYESEMHLDLSWDPPKGTKIPEGEPLPPSKHTNTLIVHVAKAFGFSASTGRLRTHLRKYGDLLRSQYVVPDTRTSIGSGEYRGKRLGDWRPPVIADLGGVTVEVMLAGAEEPAMARQSDLAATATHLALAAGTSQSDTAETSWPDAPPDLGGAAG